MKEALKVGAAMCLIPCAFAILFVVSRDRMLDDAHAFFLNGTMVCSAVLLCLSVLYTASLVLFGRLAARDRRRMLSLFKLSYYGSSVWLVVLTILNSAIFVVFIYFIEHLYLHRVIFNTIAIVVVGGLLGTGAIAYFALRSMMPRPLHIEGVPVPRDSELWNAIQDQCRDMHVDPVEHVIIGDEPSFFVVEAPVVCGSRCWSGRTIYLSRTITRFLETSELTAILVHEISHFKGLDAQFSRSFYPVFRGLGDSIEQLNRMSLDVMAVPLIPSRMVMEFIQATFLTAERRFSRERELAADAEAVQRTSGLDFGKALVKVCLLSKAQESAVRAMARLKDTTGSGGPPLDDHIDQAVGAFTEADVTRVLADEMPHPYDTHPTIQARLDQAGATVDSIRQAMRFCPRDLAGLLQGSTCSPPLSGH